ncbi:uncharacterized protein [Apostichopus japonicus]|uniref:uncharacterized protein n=1 Tax=Stichopus japonicus TaxID=307972 RepID=UPI003AB82A5F
MNTCFSDDQFLIGYDDDHSIYSSFKPGDVSSELESIRGLSSTLENVKLWMQFNRLKMNDEKSEFIVFGSNRQSAIQTFYPLWTLPSVTDSVKLLDVYMDETLNLKHHISLKVRASALAMFNLKKIREYLDKSTCRKIANAMIFSHMDFCNGLFINLPGSTLHPLQRIQNYTAKIILGRSKYDSASAALKELHILLVNGRVEYKILLLVYKCIHNSAPAYLSELLDIKTPVRSTRSSKGILLKVPFTRRQCFAGRSFSVAGPRLWNALPVDTRNSKTRTFKVALKTHLCKKSFL